VSAPGERHEALVYGLGTLAALMGFTLPHDGRLPDGARPDVLREDLWRRRLFIGDAKASEWPEGIVLQRVSGYAVWMEAHRLAGGTGMLLIATPMSHMAAAWVKALAELPLARVATPVRSRLDRSAYIVGLATEPRVAAVAA